MGLEDVEFVMDIEKEFDIEIPDTAMQHVRTVGEFHDEVAKFLREQRPDLSERPGFEHHLWSRISTIAADNGYNITPAQVSRDSRFVEDLGYG